ncbi:hypothetical protein FSP39_020582 [Pinctada imbricata]|uniref:Uncharacterized protein n=1 Tax=Pinctada imbricata TaxID=66713 RepID=A0AA88Y9N6_PINIB|nr:hypothetical protein FSP39_020582 [Pinctada imbricata]
MSKIKHWINDHAETFFNSHSNLTAISACPIRSRERKRILQQEWCIVFYCTNKGQLPHGEKLFPEKIDDYAIDVREQSFTTCSKTNDDLSVSNENHSKLSMGAQIEIEQGRIGTLGCFLQLNENSVGFLTCAHVCMSENVDIRSYSDSGKKQKVYQPDRQSSSKEIGYVRSISFTHGERYKVSVDAALVILTDSNRLPVDGYFVKAKDEDLRRAGTYTFN